MAPDGEPEKTPIPTTFLAEDGKPFKLLVVEDNTELRNYIKGKLEKYYEIRTAANGKSAMDKALHYGPDLIISDIMMPIMNGF